MDFSMRDALTAAAIVFSTGALVQQARAAIGAQKQQTARLDAVEKLAGDTAALVKQTADALRATVEANERVIDRLDNHERESSAITERVNNHGQEIVRLRDKMGG